MRSYHPEGTVCSTRKTKLLRLPTPSILGLSCEDTMSDPIETSKRREGGKTLKLLMSPFPEQIRGR